jgi:hypothetical protein
MADSSYEYSNRVRKLANTLMWTFKEDVASVFGENGMSEESCEYRARNGSFVSSFRGPIMRARKDYPEVTRQK